MSEVIRVALTQFGVDFSHCAVIAGGTTKYCDYTVTDGERSFVSVELGNHWSGPMVLGGWELDYMRNFDVIHSCCNAKMEDEIRKLADLPALLTYDFSVKDKYRTDEYLDKVCPYLDLALFSCEPMDVEAAEVFCRRFHEKGAGHVVITMGAKGCLLYTSPQKILCNSASAADPDRAGIPLIRRPRTEPERSRRSLKLLPKPCRS